MYTSDCSSLGFLSVYLVCFRSTFICDSTDYEFVWQNTASTFKDTMANNMSSTGESKNMCEVRFGSYCLWREEHRENMKDSMVKKMKDLLFVARAYYPSIAKLPALNKLSHELKQNIQEFERVLSETTADKDLPSQYG